MRCYFVGLDVSKDATAVCLGDHCGDIVTSFKKPTDPDVHARTLGAEMEHIVCVVLETRLDDELAV
jgi:transposase